MSAPLRILMVDDDPGDRQLVRTVLQRSLRHASIEEAVSMTAAVAWLDRAEFDVALVDFRLGAATGLDVVAEFRRRNLATPIIMLTGVDSEQLVIQAMQQGVCDYVLKSFADIRALPQRIVRLLAPEAGAAAGSGGGKPAGAVPAAGARNAAQYLRSAFENSRTGIVITDLDGVAVYVNPAACAILGRSSTELVGSPFRVAAGGQEPADHTGMSQLLSGRTEHIQFERSGRRDDGQTVWFDVHAHLVRDAGMRPDYVICQIRDLTAQRQLHQAHERSARLAQLLSVVAVAANGADSERAALQACLDEVCRYLDWPVGHVFLRDADGSFASAGLWHGATGAYEGFRRASATLRPDTGGDPAGRCAITGRPELVADLAREPAAPRTDAARNAGLRHALFVPLCIVDRVAGILEFYGANTDALDADLLDYMESAGAQVSRAMERYEHQRRLHESERKFATVFRSSPDPMSLCVVSSGEILEVNDAFVALTMRPREQLIGHNVLDIGLWTDPRDRQRLIDLIRAGGAVRNFTAVLRDGAGSVRRCTLSAEIMEVAGQACVLITNRDLTEMLEAEEALQRSHRALSLHNACNHAVIHAPSGDELATAVCREIVCHAGYAFAWVGYPEDDAGLSLYPVAHAAAAGLQLDRPFFRCDDTAMTALVETSLRRGEPSVADDLCAAADDFCRHALEAGIRAVLALPLKAGDAPFGALFVYATRQQAFDAAERSLLAGIAGSLAFGILSLHSRAERERAEQSLRISEQRYRVLFEEHPSIFFTIDRHGQVTSVNRFGAAALGYSEQELLDMSLFDLCAPDCVHEARARVARCFATDADVHRWELRLLRKDQSAICVRQSARLVVADHGCSDLFVVSEDITEIRQLSDELSYLATHDPLTGLINRTEFETRLGRLLGTPDVGTHALCYLDLDQFKLINDSGGHCAGDELLRQLGGLLQREVRSRDTVARLGGDEFAILMERCPLGTAERKCRGILQQIGEHRFHWEERTFRVGASIGIVPLGPQSGGVSAVMKKADAACYSAKDAGRNQIFVFHDDAAARSERLGQMAWIAQINDALELDRLQLFFQPIVPLQGQDADPAHFEVLLRLLEPGGELVTAQRFLPSAERFNLSDKIDRWVIRRVLRLLATLAGRAHRPCQFFINLSGHSLGKREFLDFLVQNLARLPSSTNRICFEITETAAISNVSGAVGCIEELRSMGHSFALDDFGSGLSSFAYLRNLNVQYLKIDGIFVREMDANPNDVAIVRSITEIGKSLGKLIVAEGVETPEVCEMVRAAGVEYAQGFATGRPVSFDQMLAEVAGNVVRMPR